MVLLDTGNTGSAPTVSWDDTTLPMVQMAQYDANSKTTLFSGKTLKRIKLFGDGVAAGTATVGTQALADLDSGVLNVENKVTVTVDSNGIIDFGTDGFYIPANHTLALFDKADTCRASYHWTSVTADNYMYLPNHWAMTEKPNPAIKLCAVFYV